MKDTVWRLVDHLRGPLEPAAALELVLQMLVWEKWSNEGKLPPALCLTRSEMPQHYVERWRQLGGHDPVLQPAFPDDKNLTRLGETGVQAMVELVLHLRDTGVLQHLDVADVATGLAGNRGEGHLCHPTELADLMLALGGLQAGHTLYLPWDFSAQLSVRGMRQGAAEVYLETPNHAPLPLLIGLLTGGPLAVRYGDPISAPTAIEGGKPRQFDVAIAFPPLNQRYEREVVDWFQRFPEKTQSGTVLAIRHLLAQARRRVVVAVAPSLLFARGAEAALRQDLLQRGLVQAVVAMPGGILSATNIAFAVLILDPDGGHRSVRFVNAEGDRFREPVSKARARLANTAALNDLILGEAADPDVAVVAVKDILANDAQLQVSRYIVPPAQQRLQAKLAQADMVALGELVTTLRPLATKALDSDDPVAVWEVGPADLPPYGYIQDAGRMVSLPREIAQQSNEKQFLRPHDIVLIVKGNVGKVGIVPPEVPPPGEGGWLAGPSAMVLRLDGAAGIDPRALFLQLRSPLGQALLQGIVSGGATMQMINLSELKALQVLQPSAAEQAQAAKALEEEVGLQQEIERLRQQQARITLELWPLD